MNEPLKSKPTVRVIEIELSSRTDVDSIVFRLDADGTWQTVMDEIEQVLDQQFSECEAGERQWDEVGVKIKGREMTEEELDELEE